MVFPLYHIFADVAEMHGSHVVKSLSSQPLKADSLLLRSGDWNRLHVCNLTNEPQEVCVNDIATDVVSFMRLNESTFEMATMKEQEFRAQEPERASVLNGRWSISLLPFETVRVDWMNV
jgi:hypothetical protein